MIERAAYFFFLFVSRPAMAFLDIGSASLFLVLVGLLGGLLGFVAGCGLRGSCFGAAFDAA
jgi:hypothetical protein